MASPSVFSGGQWLGARLRLLEKKGADRMRDACNAERRGLPEGKVEKEHVFDGPVGKITLAGLFGDSRHLVVYHTMSCPDWDAASSPDWAAASSPDWDAASCPDWAAASSPDWDAACPSCTELPQRRPTDLLGVTNRCVPR